MAAKKKKTEEAQREDLNSAITERLDAIQSQLDRLCQAVFQTQEQLAPKKVRKKVLIAPANADTALRARVGRVARSYGMTMQQWIDLHGMRDKKLGRGVDAWEPTRETSDE